MLVESLGKISVVPEFRIDSATIFSSADVARPSND
jgi:hypothetical protein